MAQRRQLVLVVEPSEQLLELRFGDTPVKGHGKKVRCVSLGNAALRIEKVCSN
jgi:hypothetical protein